jgi:hypothetical protein
VTVEIEGTGLHGMCPAETAVELRQAKALKDLLPQIFYWKGPASSAEVLGCKTMVGNMVR